MPLFAIGEDVQAQVEERIGCSVTNAEHLALDNRWFDVDEMRNTGGGAGAGTLAAR